MTQEEQIMKAVRVHSPMKAAALREALRMGKDGLYDACRNLLRRRELVRVAIGSAVYYALPRHEEGLLKLQGEHQARIAQIAKAKAEAREKEETRRLARKEQGKRYEWPSKSEYVPPAAIPISIFHYAQTVNS